MPAPFLMLSCGRDKTASQLHTTAAELLPTSALSLIALVHFTAGESFTGARMRFPPSYFPGAASPGNIASATSSVLMLVIRT